MCQLSNLCPAVVFVTPVQSLIFRRVWPCPFVGGAIGSQQMAIVHPGICTFLKEKDGDENEAYVFSTHHTGN